MAWEVLTAEDVLSEFTPTEASALRNLGMGSGTASGSGSGPPFVNMDLIVIHVIDEVRDFIRAGAYPLDAVFDNTIPVGLFADAIAIARWRVLIAVPQLRQLQTDERKQAFDDAMKKMFLIAAQQFAVEPPIPDTNP